MLATGAGIAPAQWRLNGNPKVLSAFDVRGKGAETGKKIVVLGGDGRGLLAAETLAADGKEVSVVEEGERIGWDVIPTWKWRHDKWIREFSVQVYAATRVKEVSGSRVRISNKEGKKGFIEADTIVQAGPRKAQQDLLGLRSSAWMRSTSSEMQCDPDRFTMPSMRVLRLALESEQPGGHGVI